MTDHESLCPAKRKHSDASAMPGLSDSPMRERGKTGLRALGHPPQPLQGRTGTARPASPSSEAWYSRLEFGRRRRVPLCTQMQATECGLACLAMVASSYGYLTDVAALRARFGTPVNGISLRKLAEYAEQLQLGARAAQLELEEVAQLRLPCILHWQMSHFVVLVRVRRDGITVNDPANGVRSLCWAEASKKFTGIALELTPLPAFRPSDQRRRVSLGALIGRIEGLWGAFWTIVVLALALEVLGLLAPVVNQWVIDDVLKSGDRGMLNVMAGGLFLLMCTQTILGQARGWTVMHLSTQLRIQWSANVFSHMIRLPMVWFEQRHLGDILSRFGAAAVIQQTLTTGFITAVLDGLMAGITLAMMLMYSTKLSAIVLGAVLLYALLRVASYYPLRSATQEQIEVAAREQSCLVETLRAMQAIKLGGREVDRRCRWLNLAVDTLNRGFRTQILGLWFGSANAAVSHLSALLILWLGASLVIDTQLTIGMYFAFSAYAGTFTGRLMALIERIVEFRMLSLHAERLADIVLERTEPAPSEACMARVATLTPRFELCGVGFRYGEAEPWVLRGVNLVIEAGESVALVGPSGGGKSTLVKLLLGILEPSEGEILYGGVPVRQLSPAALRSAMAAVMQDDQLLAGSLGDNITFFDPQPNYHRAAECAQLAAVHDEILAMPMGYETLVGDMGCTLSGGQKQRLVLARALYRRPRVLVLDEATSNLDVGLESRVNAAVAGLRLTRIIVAHRPETIASAGRVVLVKQGSALELKRPPCNAPLHS